MERWRLIPGSQEYYVSDGGQIRSVDRLASYVRRCRYSGRDLTVTRRHRGRTLRPAPRESGHLGVMLGRGIHMDVHIAVLLAFVGPRPPGGEGLHYDDDPTNNSLRNLRWGTRSDNLHDAVRNGRALIGSKHRAAKLTESDVIEIRRLLPVVTLSQIGRIYRVSEATIRQIKDGKCWKHVQKEDRHDALA